MATFDEINKENTNKNFEKCYRAHGSLSANRYTDADLDGIIMQCPDEDTSYPSPKLMEDNNGNRLYAYVVLIMLGDKYIPGAIAAAHHLKKIGTKADLVVMVTPDVTEAGRKVLARFYDKLVDVPLIYVPNWRTQKQPHRKYLDYVFTKFHLFNLTEYEKVILLDADALVLKYPDHLFSLNAPAGSMIPYKSDMISYDENCDYVLPKNKQIKWYQEYCNCCAHGKIIPKKYTDEVVTAKGHSGVGAAILLLKPKKGELDSILSDIKKEPGKTLVNKFIWPEQQYLTLRYSGQWTSVNPRFYGLQGYPHWKLLFVLQFAGDKPWFLNSKEDISKRLKYADFILWHDIYTEILTEHPDLKQNSVLDEANQMNKFFTVKLHRQNSKYKQKRLETDIETIQKIFDLPPESIHKEQLQYYHLNSELPFRPIIQQKIMFAGIKQYDYLSTINKLRQYYQYSDSQYYEKLFQRHELTFDPIKHENIRIDEYENINQMDADEIALQYIKCRPATYIITLWTLSFQYMEQIIKFLMEHGNVYYTKKIDLSYDGLRNLMFMMYDEYTMRSRLDTIDKKLSYIDASKLEKNKIGVIAFDYVDQEGNLAGDIINLKRQLRNYLVKDLIKNDKIWGNDLVHINDHYYQTIEYAQVLFNKNSIKLIDQQNVNTFINNGLSFMKLQTIRKWCYMNLSPLEFSRFILLSGSVLFAFGIRKINDVDGMVVNVDEGKTKEEELEQLIQINFFEQATKFPFVDIGMTNTVAWKESWTEKNKELLNALKIENFADIVLDPAHHFYYNGIKYYLLDYELIKKILQQNPSDYADLIMIYFNHKNLIGNLIYLDKNNKLQFTAQVETTKPDRINYQKIFHHIQKKYKPAEYKNITVDVIKQML